MSTNWKLTLKNGMTRNVEIPNTTPLERIIRKQVFDVAKLIGIEKENIKDWEMVENWAQGKQT